MNMFLEKRILSPVDLNADTDSSDDDASTVITPGTGSNNSSGSLFEKPGTK